MTNPPVTASVEIPAVNERVRATIVKNITKGSRWLLLDLSKEPATIVPGPGLTEQDWRKARRTIDRMVGNEGDIEP